jgi:hypothetical protein
MGAVRGGGGGSYLNLDVCIANLDVPQRLVKTCAAQCAVCKVYIPP